MKVSELIDMLKKVPQDIDVYACYETYSVNVVLDVEVRENKAVLNIADPM